MTMAASDDRVVAATDPGKGLPGRVTIPGYATQLGPLGHLAAERHRLAALEWEHFDVTLQSATVGGEIHGIDLRQDLRGRGVRRRSPGPLGVQGSLPSATSPSPRTSTSGSPAGSVSSRVHPFIPSNTGEPELVRFEKDAEAGGYENGWHHDVTWRRTPSLGAMLRAVTVPPTGGDTLFCDANAAYEGLDDETKEQISGLVAVHDFMQAFRRQVPPEKMDEMREKYPLAPHPVVIAHPVTGKPLLYVNRFFVSHIEGMDEDESCALIDRLCRQFDTVEYQCRFRWQPDSIACWDNRAVQHYASSDYYPDVRVMERASVAGDAPAAYRG